MTSAERVAEQRARVAARKTEPVALPDMVGCALVGMSFIDAYPLNVRALERTLAANYWADRDTPAPVAGRLRHNPDNEHDANTIEVWFGDSMLGHLPRAVAARIAPDLDAGINWACVLTGVRTHPADVDCPGVDVRLTRITGSPSHPGFTMEDVIAEAVAEMLWGEVNYELAIRDLPIPDGLDAMRARLVEVYMAERDAILAHGKGE